jgi:spermidine synthase
MHRPAAGAAARAGITGPARGDVEGAAIDDSVDDAVPFVREELASKSLYFSIEDVQSRMQLRHPEALDLSYTRTMMGFLMFAPAPRRIAMVGLGGGSLAKFCFRHLPRARIDVVEINPKVIALRDEFRIPPDGERFRVIQADAAAYMADCDTRYDVVLLDGFGPHGLPRRLGAQRYFDDCVDALEAGGVLVQNLHSAARDCAACIDRIERSLGGSVLVVPDGRRVNSIVFGRKGGPLAGSSGAPPAWPKGLDKQAGEQLADAFERMTTALAAPARREVVDAGR